MARMKNKGKGKPKKPAHTPLSEHRKRGTALTTPFAEYPMETRDWPRDTLPEYLWIGSLGEILPPDKIHNAVYDVMDAVDEFWDESYPPIGLVSDFGHVLNRDGFLAKYGELVREAIIRPFGSILALYPESPASWLITPEFQEEMGHLAPDTILGELRSLIVKLYDGQGPLATRCKMTSFARVMKAGKMFFHKGSSADLLPRYPDGLTKDERDLAESFVRATMNGVLGQIPRLQNRSWAQYFWRHNYDLATCQPSRMRMAGENSVSKVNFGQLESAVATNCQHVRDYLERLAMQYRIDLYAPLQYEILAGLFSRCVRLFLLINENPRLWARDVSGIMLRCFVETAISFAYLGEKGTNEEFRRFRDYGRGQKKLLMLHLQDSYEDETTLEGQTIESISDELGGGFAAEMLQIELGNWAKKDARRLALEVGLENYYRLVFTPTSADVHGTWASLSDSNLCVCAEPLHRFHQMPSYAEPPLFVNTLVAAQELLSNIFKRAVDRLGFPSGLELIELRPFLRTEHVTSEPTIVLP